MENCIFSLCLDVRNFLKLLKKTCLHKGGFQDFFDIHFSLWTFGGSTVKFFSGSQRASHLCSPEKNFTVSPPNVRREKFMSKNPENHLYVGASFSTLQEIFTSAEREKNRPLQKNCIRIEAKKKGKKKDPPFNLLNL